MLGIDDVSFWSTWWSKRPLRANEPNLLHANHITLSLVMILPSIMFWLKGTKLHSNL
jgi:hypothetical protein